MDDINIWNLRWNSPVNYCAEPGRGKPLSVETSSFDSKPMTRCIWSYLPNNRRMFFSFDFQASPSWHYQVFDSARLT